MPFLTWAPGAMMTRGGWRALRLLGGATKAKGLQKGGGITRKRPGMANAWKKRDRGCSFLIKQPMDEAAGESGSAIQRTSCPMGHSRTGTKERARIQPGLALAALTGSSLLLTTLWLALALPCLAFCSGPWRSRLSSLVSRAPSMLAALLSCHHDAAGCVGPRAVWVAAPPGDADKRHVFQSRVHTKSHPVTG